MAVYPVGAIAMRDAPVTMGASRDYLLMSWDDPTYEGRAVLVH